MFTTAGLMRWTTSAKLATVDPKPPPIGRAAARVAPSFAAPAAIDDRLTPPATIAPTRNATTAVSASVTTVNRRDMGVTPAPGGGLRIDYKLAEGLFIERFDAERARFLQL